MNNKQQKESKMTKKLTKKQKIDRDKRLILGFMEYIKKNYVIIRRDSLKITLEEDADGVFHIPNA
ncbi:MAG: hypothetical protein NZ735_02695 [Candidatus Marinimicrobia bacterium]|jgi:hypothetical protein|uniref:Uncharacterized protein n=1 Tax=marine metagenome TaxID=408172 RepID=A0A382E4I6_9ZZZZ|nr:hypothetical protein [Candidatus Neomarinimicrobiota bacterium]